MNDLPLSGSLFPDPRIRRFSSDEEEEDDVASTLLFHIVDDNVPWSFISCPGVGKLGKEDVLFDVDTGSILSLISSSSFSYCRREWGKREIHCTLLSPTCVSH